MKIKINRLLHLMKHSGKITGKTIPEDEIRDAMTRLEFNDPIKESLFKMADNAYKLGYLENVRGELDLSNIFDLTILDDIINRRQ